MCFGFLGVVGLKWMVGKEDGVGGWGGGAMGP